MAIVTTLQKIGKETRSPHNLEIYRSHHRLLTSKETRQSKKIIKDTQACDLLLGSMQNYTAFHRGLEMLCFSPTSANCTVPQVLLFVKLVSLVIPGSATKEGILESLNA